MPKYLVQYADASGAVTDDLIEAGTERAALAQTEAHGFTPISVRLAHADKQPARTAQAPGRRGKRPSKSLVRAVTDFTQQMAAVAESGIPVVQALRAIREQTAHPALKAALGRIAGRIEGGRTLADALDAEPAIFSTIYVKTVAAGELAGKLPEVFLSLARYQEQEDETATRVKSALFYPALVVGTLVIATLFMLIFVVPQFARMFEQFKGELPAPTRILLFISGAMMNHPGYVLAAVAGLVLLFRLALRQEAVRDWLDVHLLSVPVFGKLLLGVYMVRFVELIDLLTQAALPITHAINATADAMTNRAIRRDVRGMLRAVEGGRSLTEAFAGTRFLTPLVKRMLAIGEQAGRTEQVFAYVRNYYVRQTSQMVRLLSTLIEPVMVCCLAGVVLFFALAIFLPMWKLLKLVGTA